jgi:hypothetical protein
MSYIILRGWWFHVIVLNIHAPTDDKNDDGKDNFYEELEHIFDKFPKYHMKILLWDFSAKIGKEDFFKPIIGNERLHEISNDNGVVNFATSKNLIVKSTVFPHCSIHKYTWTSPDGNTHNQIDHILIDTRTCGQSHNWKHVLLTVLKMCNIGNEYSHYFRPLNLSYINPNNGYLHFLVLSYRMDYIIFIHYITITSSFVEPKFWYKCPMAYDHLFLVCFKWKDANMHLSTLSNLLALV